MNQEWGEDDLTPTAADLDAAYGSRFTSALDIGNKRIRDNVTKVWMEELPQLDGKPLRKKCVIGCRTLPKPIALNATNKDVLVRGIGKDPADWIGCSIGIFTEPTKNPQGQTVLGLRLKVLSARATSAPKPAPSPALSPAAETAPPLDEFGDPGPNPEDAINFGTAAE